MSVLADNLNFKNALFHFRYKAIEILFLQIIMRENLLIFFSFVKNSFQIFDPPTEIEYLKLLPTNCFTLKFALENLVGYW